MLAAAKVLFVMRSTGKPLSDLAAGYSAFPSVSRNLKVSRKPEFSSVPALAVAIREGQAALKEGRLLVRYSGTEPLLRILAEGPDRSVLERVVDAVIRAAVSLA